MRAILLVAILLALGMPVAPHAAADPYPQGGDCASAGQPAIQRIEITGGSAVTTAYVDDENYALGNGVWVYQETNDVWVAKAPGVYLEGLSNANLQRGGGPFIFSSPSGHNEPDICYDQVDVGPDTMIL